MQILENFLKLFISPRFISFYWKTGLVALVQLIALISESLPELGLPQFAMVAIGLFLSEITKALNNLKRGRDMGFAPKQYNN